MPNTTKRHHETPLKRVNPSGKTVWVARYTDSDGVRQFVKPKATFATKGAAQDAIAAAYALPTSAPETVGEYSPTWLDRHPRSKRTNDTNSNRLDRVLDVKLEGRKLRDWPYRELRRRHAVELADVLLRERGLARLGVVGLLSVLSAMTEDAITDEVADVNAFKGVKVRSNDPRIRKAPRAPRVFTFAELHEFASCGRAIVSLDKAGKPRPNVKPRNYEALLRAFTDLGGRLGEILCLERRQLVDGVVHFEGTAHDGQVTGDTDTKHHDRLVPATPALLELLAARPPRIDTPLLFPTPSGRLWRERNFYRDVWVPARELWGRDITPHDCRHSWVTHLSAAGVDEADLAAMAGHDAETMRRVYRHPLHRSFEAVRRAIAG